MERGFGRPGEDGVEQLICNGKSVCFDDGSHGGCVVFVRDSSMLGK